MLLNFSQPILAFLQADFLPFGKSAAFYFLNSAIINFQFWWAEKSPVGNANYQPDCRNTKGNGMFQNDAYPNSLHFTSFRFLKQLKDKVERKVVFTFPEFVWFSFLGSQRTLSFIFQGIQANLFSRD